MQMEGWSLSLARGGLNVGYGLIIWYRGWGSNPHGPSGPQDFKS